MQAIERSNVKIPCDVVEGVAEVSVHVHVRVRCRTGDGAAVYRYCTYVPRRWSRYITHPLPRDCSCVRWAAGRGKYALNSRC